MTTHIARLHMSNPKDSTCWATKIVCILHCARGGRRRETASDFGFVLGWVPGRMNEWDQRNFSRPQFSANPS